MTKIKLTKEERNAIATLKRLADRWPASLWIFAGGDGQLSVMRLDGNSKKAVTNSGGFDPEYVVADIDIPSDGGAW